MSRQMNIGGVTIGGGADITIQSMCNTATEDVAATVAQILRLEQAGCQIIRVAVPTMAAAAAIGRIKKAIHIPLVADIHFDYKLALRCAAEGVDKIRINPGNIGAQERVRAVAEACRDHHIPIRIGVNGGSLEKPLLAKYGVNSEDALLSAAERGSFDYSFLDSGKSGIARLEGYLFPDTYEFFVNEDPSHAICRLLDNFSQRMDDELMTQVEESGYSLEEILIIASLIEKETDGKDRTNIASVIYNRLNNVGETYHKLEIDAAVIYGLGYANGENYAGPLTQADLDKDTPYNLRMHEGLPPTPICNPGLASIRAALEPADTNYYFYALGKDGVHHFFKTYREHVNFVNSSQYGG